MIRAFVRCCDNTAHANGTATGIAQPTVVQTTGRFVSCMAVVTRRRALASLPLGKLREHDFDETALRSSHPGQRACAVVRDLGRRKGRAAVRQQLKMQARARSAQGFIAILPSDVNRLDSTSRISRGAPWPRRSPRGEEARPGPHPEAGCGNDRSSSGEHPELGDWPDRDRGAVLPCPDQRPGLQSST
jgi:hypothetical protein